MGNATAKSLNLDFSTSAVDFVTNLNLDFDFLVGNKLLGDETRLASSTEL